MKYYRFFLYPHLKNLVLIVLWLVTPACYNITAHAYVLPGPYLLEKMTQNLGKAKRLLVTQKLKLYDDKPQTSSVELSENVKYIFPNTFRSDIVLENIRRIHVLSKGSVFTAINGKASDGLENRYDLYKDLLLFRSRKMLQERLLYLGVNVKISSLGRFQGQPAYILGAQYPDKAISQLWLDKDSFRPFRWIMTGKANQSLEIRYLNWHKTHSVWYPMRIEFLSNGNLVRKIQVKSIKVNPSFSKKLFNIEYLKLRYPRAALSEAADQSNKENLNEIQKIIEEFKKTYK